LENNLSVFPLFKHRILHTLLVVESLQKIIGSISTLSNESKDEFFAVWKHWSVPKDHYLLKEHAVANYIYYFEKGAARIYYHKNGKEITEWFALEGQMCLSITSFFKRTPSHLMIQTLVPAEVYGIHHDDLMRLAAKYHDVETLLRKMLTWSLILSQERMDSIQFESSQQRYNKLITNSPEIIQQVPLTYIASYLGITLETLSRIRSVR